MRCHTLNPIRAATAPDRRRFSLGEYWRARLLRPRDTAPCAGRPARIHPDIRIAACSSPVERRVEAAGVAGSIPASGATLRA